MMVVYDCIPFDGPPDHFAYKERDLLQSILRFFSPARYPKVTARKSLYEKLL